MVFEIISRLMRPAAPVSQNDVGVGNNKKIYYCNGKYRFSSILKKDGVTWKSLFILDGSKMFNAIQNLIKILKRMIVRGIY